MEDTVRGEEALRRCRQQERALERIATDFGHLAVLVERVVLGAADDETGLGGGSVGAIGSVGGASCFTVGGTSCQSSVGGASSIRGGGTAASANGGAGGGSVGELGCEGANFAGMLQRLREVVAAQSAKRVPAGAGDGAAASGEADASGVGAAAAGTSAVLAVVDGPSAESASPAASPAAPERRALAADAAAGEGGDLQDRGSASLAAGPGPSEGAIGPIWYDYDEVRDGES